MAQILGLKAIYAGDPIETGISVATVTPANFPNKLTQPYQGGVTISYTEPTENSFRREGQTAAAVTILDSSTGELQLTWEVLDFDETTKKFYFGNTRRKYHKGEKAFAFISESGQTVAYAKMSYRAGLVGGYGSGEPERIAVTATMLMPEDGEPWDNVPTPEAWDTDSESPAPAI